MIYSNYGILIIPMLLNPDTYKKVVEYYSNHCFLKFEFKIQ